MMSYVWIARDDEFESTSRYRAFNTHRHLIRQGIHASCWIGFDASRWWVTDPPTTLWGDVEGSTVVVQRIPYDLNTKVDWKRTKSLAERVGFDIDDLVFDHALLPPNSNMDEYHTKGYAAAIEYADFVTVSTPDLRSEVQLRWPGKTVYVVPNVVGPGLTKAAELVSLQRHSDQVVIGYSSGTSMHEQDFAMVAPVLDRLLDEYTHLRVAVIGTLPIAPEYEAKWGKRLIRWPFISFDALPHTMAGLFDISIVPLRDTRFNRCKSVVKWIEGSLFGVPTVVTPIGDFDRLPATVVGRAITADEWYDRLNGMVISQPTRQSLGDRARQHCLSHYTCGISSDLGGLLCHNL